MWFPFEGFAHARLLVEGSRHAGRGLRTVPFTQTLENTGEIAFDRFTARTAWSWRSPTPEDGCATDPPCSD